MLTDFSARRPELWPTLARELYEVYEVHPTSADVKEGSSWPTRMWERVRYDWSAPGRVRELRGDNSPGAATGGSHVHVDWSRAGIGLKGQALVGLVVLTRGAIIQRAFDRVVQKS